MTLTTTDLNEYRAIPAKLKRLYDRRNYYEFIMDPIAIDGVKDEIEILRKRRKQLRRKGAY